MNFSTWAYALNKTALLNQKFFETQSFESICWLTVECLRHLGIVEFEHVGEGAKKTYKAR